MHKQEKVKILTVIMFTENSELQKGSQKLAKKKKKESQTEGGTQWGKGKRLSIPSIVNSDQP